MKMKADAILVRPEKYTEAQAGLIVMPDTMECKQTFARGLVQEVGPGLWHQNGMRSPVEVEVGDHILYFKKGAIPIVVRGEKMHIVREREVIAALEAGEFGTIGDSTNA